MPDIQSSSTDYFVENTLMEKVADRHSRLMDPLEPDFPYVCLLILQRTEHFCSDLSTPDNVLFDDRPESTKIATKYLVGSDTPTLHGKSTCVVPGLYVFSSIPSIPN